MSSSTPPTAPPNLHTGESYQEKAVRKFKEQPLVPIGAAATTGALIMAMVKMKRGDSRSLNNWLRVRVIAQGLTIAAVCVGTWALSHEADAESKKTRQLEEIQAKREERQGRERVEFEGRLKEAEEVWAESQGKKVVLAAQPKGTVKAVPAGDGPSSSREGSGRSVSSPGSSWWSWRPWRGSSGSSPSTGDDSKKA